MMRAGAGNISLVIIEFDLYSGKDSTICLFKSLAYLLVLDFISLTNLAVLLVLLVLLLVVKIVDSFLTSFLAKLIQS